MATGSGKTVVIAMLIAWQIGVGGRHRISTKYDKHSVKTRAFASPNAAEIVSANALRAAAIAGCIAMVLENAIHVHGGNRAAKEAAVEVWKGVATKGAVSFTGGAVVTLVADPTMAASAPVLVTIGRTVCVVGPYRRISDALGPIRRTALEDGVNPAGGVMIE